MFFVLVHIPLSRYSSFFCFVTAMVPLALNLKSKYWVYEQTNKFVLLFFKNDKYAKNFVQKPKDFDYGEKDVNLGEEPTNDIYLTREEAEQQENGAYVTVLYHSIFFSLSFNYLYQTFLQEIIVSNFLFFMFF